MDNDRPRLLALTAMARLLRVPPRWLREEAEVGRIPGVRAGTTFLFDPTLVEQLLLERARQGATTQPVETTSS